MNDMIWHDLGNNKTESKMTAKGTVGAPTCCLRQRCRRRSWNALFNGQPKGQLLVLIKRVAFAHRGSVLVELQVDLVPMRGPRAELELAGLGVERPVSQVKLAQGLRGGARLLYCSWKLFCLTFPWALPINPNQSCVVSSQSAVVKMSVMVSGRLLWYFKKLNRWPQIIFHPIASDYCEISWL
jgi:hypothetical protein